MRLKNSITNIMASVFAQIIAALIGFAARQVFIASLGDEYLGVNGLFSNILSMLSLVELGIGPAIIYHLYKPLAENDEHKLQALMSLYKKAYSYIGVSVLLLGIVLSNYLHVFIKNMPDILHIKIIFLLFVINAALSYFFSYKRSLIIADQKQYIVTVIHYIFFICLNILQVLVLYVTKDYFLFLSLQIISTLIENIVISIRADRMYPFLKRASRAVLDKEDKSDIFKYTIATVMHKIGGIFVNSTDSVLISSMVGLLETGFYSNYLLITATLNGLINQIFAAITSSVGNLGVSENSERKIFIYHVTMFINFWIYGLASIALIVLVNPFISLWLGKRLLFEPYVVLILIINFYISGMRKSTLAFREGLGLVRKDLFKPLFESVINLVASIILVRYLGLIGVFIGTTISTLTTCFWIEPVVLYYYAFKVPVRTYFTRYLIYLISVVSAGLSAWILCEKFFVQTSWLSLLYRALICFFVVNVLFVIFFHRTKEFKYLFNLGKTVCGKVVFKFKK